MNNFKWLLTKLDLSCVRNIIPRSRKRNGAKRDTRQQGNKGNKAAGHPRKQSTGATGETRQQGNRATRETKLEGNGTTRETRQHGKQHKTGNRETKETRQKAHKG